LGLAVAALILSFVQYEFSYDQMHENTDRVYHVESQFYQGEELTDGWETASFWRLLALIFAGGILVSDLYPAWLK